MSTTGLRSFDKTVHQTNAWLNEIHALLGWGDRQQAWHAARAVLHALRDRLPVVEVAQLGAQLPMLVRGMYFEGWAPSPDGKPKGSRHLGDFLDQIHAGYGVGPDNVDPKVLARAVFDVLVNHVSTGEIRDVLRVLPEEIRELFVAPVI